VTDGRGIEVRGAWGRGHSAHASPPETERRQEGNSPPPAHPAAEARPGRPRGVRRGRAHPFSTGRAFSCATGAHSDEVGRVPGAILPLPIAAPPSGGLAIGEKRRSPRTSKGVAIEGREPHPRIFVARADQGHPSGARPSATWAVRGPRGTWGAERKRLWDASVALRPPARPR